MEGIVSRRVNPSHNRRTESFGNVVLGHCLGADNGEIRIFSRNTKKQDDVPQRYKNDKFNFGDVRDYDAMRKVDYMLSVATLM